MDSAVCPLRPSSDTSGSPSSQNTNENIWCAVKSNLGSLSDYLFSYARWISSLNADELWWTGEILLDRVRVGRGSRPRLSAGAKYRVGRWEAVSDGATWFGRGASRRASSKKEKRSQRELSKLRSACRNWHVCVGRGFCVGRRGADSRPGRLARDLVGWLATGCLTRTTLVGWLAPSY